MAFTRITDAELKGKGVIGQPEVPGLSAQEMQRSVEQVVREVAIPGVNRLADELEAATGAANIGMQRPAGIAEDTPAHVQGIAAAHIENRSNPHGVSAAQVGAYTKQETDAAISNRVTEIGAGDMAQAVYATNGKPGVVDRADAAERAQSAAAADDGIKVYTHKRTGTVHVFTGTGANGRALMTANVQAGDSFQVNGTPVTAYMGAESAVNMMAGQAYSGRWVSFVAEGNTLNFKGGGGPVTVQGLSADTLLVGKAVTVRQGAKMVAQVSGKLKPLVVIIMAGQEGYNGWYINSSNAVVRPNAGGTLSIAVGGKILYAKLTFITAVGQGFNLTYNVGGNSGTINSNGEFRELEFTSFISTVFTTNLAPSQARYMSLVVLGSV